MHSNLDNTGLFDQIERERIIKTMTDQELKIALANELPDMLLYHEDRGFTWKARTQPDSRHNVPVTKREWQWIACEAWRQWFLDKDHSYTNFTYFSPVASWQEIAEAYLKTKGDKS